ncbi:hypothetical protein [Actinacidiphila oryziradicis]|uniref:Uncharacterized protein n=1 Tax=Actinacidiphila oryziradicis TaxID=2571141 RepID=A0A4U0RQP8_9ACTN|nr:hypothetical protein [Actinacidiphila oryziradicis]TJZ98311.1 hypothetical protein FCI23_48550 [Actinacidiphila oryziradicis]
MTKQNASVPSPSEDSEPTSVAETVKRLYKKNKKAIVGTTMAAAVATGLLIKFAKGQHVTEDIETDESLSCDTPLPDLVPRDQGSQVADLLSSIAGHLMKINGQASEKATAACVEGVYQDLGSDKIFVAGDRDEMTGPRVS